MLLRKADAARRRQMGELRERWIVEMEKLDTLKLRVEDMQQRMRLLQELLDACQAHNGRNDE